MKEKLRGLLPYGGALAVDYYLLPLLIRDTGSAMLVMLYVIPAVTLICGMVYGARCGFGLRFGLLAAILFAPSVFIFYTASALVYIALYGCIALLGNGIGRIFYRKR